MISEGAVNVLDGPSEVDDIEDERFKSEVSCLVYLHPSLAIDSKDLLKDFHDFTLQCGSPSGTVLSSSRSVCRKCERELSIEPKRHVVIFITLILAVMSVVVQQKCAGSAKLRTLWLLDGEGMQIF